MDENTPNPQSDETEAVDERQESFYEDLNQSLEQGAADQLTPTDDLDDTI